MFASILWLKVYLKMEWKEVTGLVLVLEVTYHQLLQHFLSSGWLKGTEEKTEGRGDSKDTLQFGIPQSGNEDREGEELGGGKRWLGMVETGKANLWREGGMQSIIREFKRGPDTLHLHLPTPAQCCAGARAHRTAPAASTWQWFS